MICNENTKINGKRLVMAVAVVAVMICALAIVLPAGNVSAADEYGSIEVPAGDDVCIIDAENAADFDWSAIATDDYTAYVISTDVTFEEGETVTFSEPVYITGTGSLTLDGKGSKVIDAPVYLKSGASLVLTSSELEVTENCEIQVEAGATINVNGLAGTVDSDIIGTSESQKAMVALTEGMATISDFDMLLGAVPTGFTVDLDGVADLKETNIMGASAFQEKTTLNIGEGSELTVSGTSLTSAATINNYGSIEVTGTITNTGSITNNGTVTISGTVTSDEGIITNNGTATVSGTITGTVTNTDNAEVIINENGTVAAIDGGKVTMNGTVSADATFPSMKDNTLFEYDDDLYIIFSYKSGTGDNAKVYQYGLAAQSIEYDGSDIMDSELSVIPRAFPSTAGLELEFSNTNSMWYDKATNSSYEGALASNNEDGEAAPAAGLYKGVIRFSASVTGDGFNNNTIIKYLDLTVTPAKFTGKITITGWTEGEYDEAVNGPSIVIKDANDNEVSADDYTVSYEYFTDEGCTKSAGTDPSALEPNTYWVKATVETDNPSYTVTVPVETFTVKVSEADSEIVFHPLQDLNDDALEEAILGVNPDEIQKVVFNTEDGLKYTINGTVYKQTYTEGTKIVGFDQFGLSDKDTGYLVAFYVEGVNFNVASIPADSISDYVTVTPFKSSSNQVYEITPEENTTDYRYYLLYIPELGADSATATEPVAGEDGFTYDIDFDADDGEKYNETSYEVDASYLNFYMIVLHDDKEAGDNYYNDLLTYYRVDGNQFILPSGAGDGFSYWATEAGSTNDRVFEFGSIMVVGPQYDPDNDGVINLQAVYGAVAPGPGGDVSAEPATKVVFLIGSTDNGIEALIYGIDGSVPAGATVTVTYSYIITVNGINYSVPVTMDGIVIENDSGSVVVYLPIDLSAEENYATINSVYATLTIEGMEPMTTDVINYTPGASA